MATHIFPRQTGHRHNSVISSSKALGFEAGPQERLKEGIHDLQLQPQERQQSREGQQSTSPCLEVLCEMLFWRDAPLARCSWRDAPMARCSGEMLWPMAACASFQKWRYRFSIFGGIKKLVLKTLQVAWQLAPVSKFGGIDFPFLEV